MLTPLERRTRAVHSLTRPYNVDIKEPVQFRLQSDQFTRGEVVLVPPEFFKIQKPVIRRFKARFVFEEPQRVRLAFADVDSSFCTADECDVDVPVVLRTS